MSTFDPAISPPPLCEIDGSKFFAVRVGPDADSYSACSAFESHHRYSNDMRPGLALDDETDVGFGDSETPGHASLIAPPVAVGPDEAHGVIGELGIWMIDARAHESVSVSAPLGVAIRKVFCVCSDEKMIGVDAIRRVATVADKQAVGDGPIHEFVGEPMGVDFASIDPKFSVTILAAASVPQQTPGVRFGHATLGEALGNRPVVCSDVHGRHFTMVEAA